MLKNRRDAVEAVAEAFRDTERTAEEATILGAQCLITMLEARSNARLPIETGADALVMIAEGTVHATRAYAAFAKAHPLLKMIPSQIGVTSYGTTPSEDNKAFTGATTKLNVVASAA